MSLQFLLDLGIQYMARWQNGYAADCKSVDLGSTPGRASIQIQYILLLVILSERMQLSPSGGIGRHRRFKISRPMVVPVQVRPRAPLIMQPLVIASTNHSSF